MVNKRVDTEVKNVSLPPLKKRIIKELGQAGNLAIRARFFVTSVVKK